MPKKKENITSTPPIPPTPLAPNSNVGSINNNTKEKTPIIKLMQYLSELATLSDNTAINTTDTLNNIMDHNCITKERESKEYIDNPKLFQDIFDLLRIIENSLNRINDDLSKVRLNY